MLAQELRLIQAVWDNDPKSKMAKASIQLTIINDDLEGPSM